MANVAFVTTSGGFAGDNLYWKNRLVNTHGDTVTGHVDNNLETDDFSSYDFIIIGALIDPTQFGANAKATAKPIVVMRRTVDTEIGLASSNGSTNSATVEVQDNTHYITNVFSTGSLTVFNSAQGVQYHTTTTNDVVDLITRTSYADRPCLSVCESGDTLTDGTTAAERRSYWGLYDDDDLHANAHTIFDRLRGWLLYDDAAAETGSADLSANVTIRNKAQVDLSVNTTIQNKSQNDLSVNVTIRNKGQYDLSSSLTVVQKDQADLSCSVTIRNKAQYDLSGNFTIPALSGSADLSANFTLSGQYGYVTLADSIVHNIPVSYQVHTITLSNSVHAINVSASVHAINISDATHNIHIYSEPLT